METAEVKKSTRYLTCCKMLEGEVFRLYNNVIRKMNRPELSIIVVALAQDSLKHSKIIQELFKPITKTDLELEQCHGDIVKVCQEINNCLDALSSVEFISDDMLPDFLKDLANLEDCVYEIYSFFLESEMLENFVRGASYLMPITTENLTFIINLMMEDNLRHRDMLIEDVYFFKKNKLKNTEAKAPVVKYQNPDSWISH